MGYDLPCTFEVFYLFADFGWLDAEDNPLPEGWYWSDYPNGHVTDPKPIGPYPTSVAAAAAAIKAETEP